MDRLITSFATLAAFGMLVVTPAPAQDSEQPDGDAQDQQVRERASYAIGAQVARSIRSQAMPVIPEAVVRGLLDGLLQREPAYTGEEMDEAMTTFQQLIRANFQAMAQQNLQAGREFLAANAEKPGIETLESGLQYRVIRSGDGASPGLTDSVRTHYHGTLIDGTVFDSSVDRGEPIEFPVSGVIRGWTEALQLMQVGDKWELFIPFNLAYGPDGRLPDIPPNATLIFEVELLDVIE